MDGEVRNAPKGVQVLPDSTDGNPSSVREDVGDRGDADEEGLELDEDDAGLTKPEDGLGEGLDIED